MTSIRICYCFESRCIPPFVVYWVSRDFAALAELVMKHLRGHQITSSIASNGYIWNSRQKGPQIVCQHLTFKDSFEYLKTILFLNDVYSDYHMIRQFRSYNFRFDISCEQILSMVGTVVDKHGDEVTFLSGRFCYEVVILNDSSNLLVGLTYLEGEFHSFSPRLRMLLSCSVYLCCFLYV